MIEPKQINIFFVLFLLLILTAESIFLNHNQFLYQEQLAKVVSVEETKSNSQTGENRREEEYRKQALTLVLLNGVHKGKQITCDNQFGLSFVKSIRYRKNQEVFLKENGTEYQITGIRRDKYLVYLMTLFLAGLIVLARKRGALVALAMVLNGGFFLYIVIGYGNGADYRKMLLLLLLLLPVLTIFVTTGISLKTVGAIGSTMLTMAVTAALYQLAVKYAGDPPYELMEYITAPRELDEIFTAGLMIGCLGAIMDVTVTIHATVTELSLRNPDWNLKDMVESVRQVGYDVMGTMINVLFFTYLSTGIPMILLRIGNGYTIGAVIKYGMIFDLVHFLVGAIGIVLAVPAAGLLSIGIETGRRHL